MVGSGGLAQRLVEYREAAPKRVDEPFVGVTTNGTAQPGLFALAPTGISTEPIRLAADAFLASLRAEQRAAASFELEASAWRAWSNIHPFVMRHGVLLEECSDAQRAAALDLVRATCSARGFGLARDIMKLNEALGELTDHGLRCSS